VFCEKVWIQESIFKVIVKNFDGGVSPEKERKSRKTAKDQSKVAEYIIVFPNNANYWAYYSLNLKE
jgi:uncharacterized protein YpmB